MWTCYIYHFESPDLEIWNMSFVWPNIRGKLPCIAMQKSSELFEENKDCNNWVWKIQQSKCTLLKREMGKDGDQGESSNIQRTTRVNLLSFEASLPRSLCPEMCMICKKKDLKLKHSRQLQSKIVTKTSEKMLKEAAFARNDKEMIIVVSETYLIANQFQKTREMSLGLHENRKEKFFSGWKYKWGNLFGKKGLWFRSILDR